MIRVFSSTDTYYNSNGDVVLKPVKASIFKEDNGDFYLDIVTDLKYADFLDAGKIIVAPTPQGYQPFRIANCEKTSTKITIKAWHLFYDSENYLIADTYVVNKRCQQALDQLNSATEPTSPFTMQSNIATAKSYRCVRTSLYDAIMTVIERWGGHLIRDGHHIILADSIGNDYGITIRYKKNLKEITAEEDWDEVVTQLMPVGKDGILLNALDPSDPVYLTSATQYAIPFCKTVSFEQEIEREDYSSDYEYTEALVADLQTQGWAYLSENCVPKVNYTLKAHIDRIVDIGDTIEVRDERMGINLLTNVISYTYDCLLGRYDEIEFGNFKRTLSGLIPTITASVDKTINIGLETKQNVLISGENIKTINGADILGDGNITPTQMGLLDYFYPVGSYYETSDSTFDPNTAWGGTWVRETEGKVHIGSGSNYPSGSTGGEATHTLTVNEMPSHNHEVTSYYQNIASYPSGSNARPYTKSGSLETTNWAETASVGGGQPHNNMMPYISVNRWHRTA